MKEQFLRINIDLIITTQSKNNKLDCMIDSTFMNIKMLFVLSFKNGDNGPTRDSFLLHVISRNQRF